MQFQQYDASDLRSTEYRKDPDYPFEFIADVAGDNADLFVMDEEVVDNNELGRRMAELGAVTKGVKLDPESCCFYAYFKSGPDGIAFLKKLSAYLSQKAKLLEKAKAF